MKRYTNKKENKQQKQEQKKRKEIDIQPFNLKFV